MDVEFCIHDESVVETKHTRHPLFGHQINYLLQQKYEEIHNYWDFATKLMLMDPLILAIINPVAHHLPMAVMSM